MIDLAQSQHQHGIQVFQIQDTQSQNPPASDPAWSLSLESEDFKEENDYLVDVDPDKLELGDFGSVEVLGMMSLELDTVLFEAR